MQDSICLNSTVRRVAANNAFNQVEGNTKAEFILNLMETEGRIENYVPVAEESTVFQESRSILKNV